MSRKISSKKIILVFEVDNQEKSKARRQWRIRSIKLDNVVLSVDELTTLDPKWLNATGLPYREFKRLVNTDSGTLRIRGKKILNSHKKGISFTPPAPEPRPKAEND